MSFGFSKNERLCSRTLIERLYADGHRLMAFPYSIHWQQQSLDVPCQVLITTSKRKFKHAVDRNRVKRLTRECYRLRKHALYDFLQQHGLTLVFSMVYIHNEIMSYDQLGHKMDKLLAALQKDILAHQQPTP